MPFTVNTDLDIFKQNEQDRPFDRYQSPQLVPSKPVPSLSVRGGI